MKEGYSDYGVSFFSGQSICEVLSKKSEIKVVINNGKGEIAKERLLIIKGFIGY
ncbi:hypothetical protein GGQ92_001643 [Gracilibacillus halotolerans]|uniref:Uncharacterized protein n=1 Tax=Gracilibacillus halotolerans TaxID=74386 RepID=A0A841RPJ8_9BACI|nr:hypothetical protein [Gracilibacillus halotolerans]MBB6512854.1 hypothetical protein [Gracilibacillus halotolerans]